MNYLDKYADRDPPLSECRVLFHCEQVGRVIQRGKDALPLAVIFLVLAWLTDSVDGVFARRDPDPASSRLPGHEAKADMTAGNQRKSSTHNG